LSRSHTDFVDARPLSAAGTSWFVNHYTRLSPDTVTDPRVSPGLAQDQVLRLTPSAFVLTAGIDPLRDEGDSYARRLAELGVPTTHVCYFDMPHGFLSMLGSLDDARSAHAMLAEAIKLKIGRT
jgi:acetyl esterase